MSKTNNWNKFSKKTIKIVGMELKSIVNFENWELKINCDKQKQ